MNIEQQAGVGTDCAVRALETVPEGEPPDRRRPNVSGDLPTVLEVGPMFRRAVVGYDRFQVDTYVQWAEDELAAADREHEHLLARHLATRAALGDARELLAHSSGGGEFLGLSRRIGSMLAAAADEAEGMRAEGQAHRSVAATQAEEMVTQAERVLADAAAEAGRMVAAAATEAEGMIAEAGLIVAAAEQTATDATSEAAARLEEVRAVEQRAADQAEQIRRGAVAEALAARRQARDDVVRMLSTGREQRRRADADAAATRDRLDRDIAARRAALVAEVEELERRSAALRAELDQVAEPVATSSGALSPRPLAPLGSIQLRLGWRPGSWRSALGPSARVSAGDGGPTAA